MGQRCGHGALAGATTGLAWSLGLAGLGLHGCLRSFLTGVAHPAARDRAAVRPVRPVLEVVVAPHCFGCMRARTLTADVAARYPALEVRIVDVGQAGTEAPSGIVAVPAYVLDGHVLFTGNPTLDALAAALDRAVARADQSDMV